MLEEIFRAIETDSKTVEELVLIIQNNIHVCVLDAKKITDKLPMEPLTLEEHKRMKTIDGFKNFYDNLLAYARTIGNISEERQQDALTYSVKSMIKEFKNFSRDTLEDVYKRAKSCIDYRALQTELCFIKRNPIYLLAYLTQKEIDVKFIQYID